ncbi:hypothetical protein V1507DRAFT_468644 [Lipomyces tetrasporus]
MEALHVHRGVWNVVSGLGEYNPAILEDAIVTTKKNNVACLDMIIILEDQEPGLLFTKDAQHIWKTVRAGPLISYLVILSLSCRCYPGPAGSIVV